MKKQLTEFQKNNLDRVYNYLLHEKNIDISINRRVTDIVEYRSLFNTICNKKYKVGSSMIARYYQSKGKSMTHASVIHSIDKFKTYKEYVPDLTEIYNELNMLYFTKKFNNVEVKYVHTKKLTKVQKSVSDLTEDQQIELLEMIELRKKSWAWKNKDRITIIEGC